MSQVFISYSHDSAEHAERVAAFARRLSAAGIEVVFDQDAGDPDKGWPRWSGVQADKTERILVIVTETYKRRWEGKEEPDTGLGVTHEAKILYQRLYEAGHDNAFCRVVVFEKRDRSHIPTILKGQNIYHSGDDFDTLVDWLKKPLPGEEPDPWPVRLADFPWRMADRKEQCARFARILAGESDRRILILHGESGRGKSLLVHELIRYLEEYPDCDYSHIDCKASPTDDEFRRIICGDFGYRPEKLCDQLRRSLRIRVLVIDTYEKANEELQRWIERKLLPAVCRARRVVCVIGGQQVPDRRGTRLESEAHYFKLTPIDDPRDWKQFHEAQFRAADWDEDFMPQLIERAGGNPRLIRAIMEGPGL